MSSRLSNEREPAWDIAPLFPPQGHWTEGSYWIVDTAEQRVLVLCLQGDTHAMHGEFAAGNEAESKFLQGFRVNVAQVLQAGLEGSSARPAP